MSMYSAVDSCGSYYTHTHTLKCSLQRYSLKLLFFNFQFIKKLKPVWVPPGTAPKFNETSFIVVGPIPRETDFNITNGKSSLLVFT